MTILARNSKSIKSSVALSLAAYCAVTSVFHFIPGDPWQMSIFVKNWAIAGGCLALAVAVRRRP